jgi:hypothetical protein
MRSVALLVGIAAGLLIGLARLATNGSVTPWIVLAVVAAVVLTAGLAIRQRAAAVRSRAAGDDELSRRGLIGRATVLDARPTGHVAGDRHEYDLRLEVQLPRRRRFETDVRTLVPDSARERLRPGLAIVVAADPAEPGHVVPAFNVDELVSIAGLGPFAGGPGGPLSPPSPPGPAADR